MYRLSVTSCMDLMKIYTRSTENHMETILRKRYREITTQITSANFKTTLGMLSSIAQSIGLKDVIYNHPCYTLSLVPLFQSGRITSSRVDVSVFQYQEIEELFIEDIELDYRPGDLMVKQIILTKSVVPLRFVLHIAKYLELDTLARFVLSPTDRTDRELVEYVRERGVHGARLPVGPTGMMGPTGPHGDMGYVPDIRRYTSYSIIPYIPVPTQYYPSNLCINIEKASQFLEFMKTDNKYMITLIELERKPYM